MMDSITALAMAVWTWFPPGWQLLFANLAKIALIVAPILLGVAYLLFAERKIIGYMQVRIGPNRVGPRGWLQPIADVVKLLFKEIILPTRSNKFLFILAPVLAIAPSLAAWAVIPFTDTLVLANIDASLLYVLALTSVGVYGVIVAGWASNSKYAFLGSMRSAAQIVAYEIAMVSPWWAYSWPLVVLTCAISSCTKREISPIGIYGRCCRCSWCTLFPESPRPIARRSTWPRANPNWWPVSMWNTRAWRSRCFFSPNTPI